MKPIYILFFLALVFGKANATEESIKSISMVTLLATPEKYHGLNVRITGVGMIDAELNAICLSKEYYMYRVLKNCFGVSPDFNYLKNTGTKRMKIDGGYVLIEGVFNAKNKGPRGITSGTIEKITRLMTMEGGLQR